MNANQLRRTLTFLSRSAPYGCDRPQMCLELALAAAVFEQRINYVFLGEGVLQLLKGQNAGDINSKTLGNALETLELYGVNAVFADRDSLTGHGLREEDLLIPVTLIDGKELGALIRRSDAVFNL